MDIAFAEHVDLLDLHGRAAVASLAQLGPTDTLPPQAVLAHVATREHWATLEIWAWTLEHPDRHWSQRVEPTAPEAHGDVVAAIAVEIGRLEGLLLASGPEAGLDFFGRPGTTGEVARLLAHEAVTVARSASLAAGRTAPELRPAVAADGIDRALAHWAEPEAHVVWRPEPVALRATDTAREWHLECGLGRRGDHGAFRTTHTEEPALVISADSTTLLWWMHGYPTPEDALEISGGDGHLMTALRQGMGHDVGPVPVRRAWRRR